MLPCLTEKIEFRFVSDSGKERGLVVMITFCINTLTTYGISIINEHILIKKQMFPDLSYDLGCFITFRQKSLHDIHRAHDENLLACKSSKNTSDICDDFVSYLYLLIFSKSLSELEKYTESITLNLSRYC